MSIFVCLQDQISKKLIIIGEIMNISRLNYLQTLPFIKNTISRANYIAIDLEMSGIQTQVQTSPSILDSFQMRYQKQRQSIHKFIPLQFGLSAFTVHPQKNKIVAYPFNFHIFPLALPSDPLKFSFHAGTMTFLTKNNFDFNRLFYESIYYSRRDKLETYKKSENIVIFNKEKKKSAIANSPEVKAFLAMNWSKVQEWVNSAEESIQIDINMAKYQSYITLKENLQEKYSNITFMFSFDNQLIIRRKTMTIRKCSPEQKEANKSEEIPASEVPLFNDVVDYIIEAKKPLLLHNGFLDMMHIYQRFIAQLPPDWSTYKHKLNELFPNIYDNKYLFSNSPKLNHQTQQRNTSLETCYTAMRNQTDLTEIQIDQDFGQYSLNELECHEAGFDALMTGYSFLRGANILKKDLKVLEDHSLFRQEFDLYHNRIPQGSIKVPFNLNSQDIDIYVEDGNEPIYFQSVLHESVDQERVQQYFSSNFGPVNFFWTTKDMTDFCVIFLSLKDKISFQKHLTISVGASTSVICEISGQKYVVRSSEQESKFVNNHIQGELQGRNNT